jgi:hypothetical protein
MCLVDFLFRSCYDKPISTITTGAYICVIYKSSCLRSIFSCDKSNKFYWKSQWANNTSYGIFYHWIVFYSYSSEFNKTLLRISIRRAIIDSDSEIKRKIVENGGNKEEIKTWLAKE